MKFKKFIAILCAMCTLSAPLGVLAEREYSEEYYIVDLIAEYVSQMYIDESLTKDEAIHIALSGILEGDDELLIKALKEMLSGVDPYSEYFTAEEYKAFTNNMNSVFYGIGVVIQKKGDYVEVTGFTPDSPSQMAGVMTGDKISMIDGVSQKGKTLVEVRDAIMGELDTYVEVTFIRDNAEFTTTIKRSEVKNDTVYYDKLTDEIGCITITDMSQSTADEFKEKLGQMRDDGIKKFILDLRNNGGGYVMSAIDIAKLIVPKGKILTAEFRDQKPEVFYSDLTKKEFEIIVLVNENTASSAEILASAIQESGAGKLYGKQTYGKGVMQNSFPLMNGSVIKLTTGKYLTRNGNDIDKIGIKPDKTIENYKVPIDTTKYEQFDYKTKFDIGHEGAGVKAAKQRLSLMRYYDGEIDSNMYTESIKSSVAKFQAENGLYPYGVLDITTQVKIENSFAKLEVLHDVQFDKAYEDLGGIIE